MDVIDTERKNFIPCMKWVRRGAAKENPETVQLSKEELEQVISEAKLKLITAVEVTEEESSTAAPDAPVDEYNFEKYDEDDETNVLGIENAVSADNQEAIAFSDSDSEKEDDLIKSDDNLILIGHVEGDASILEVYVYNENEGSLYVHHDFLLPSIPLCLEWLDYEPGQSTPGSLCAVGSMSPVIEVWDLDIVNCLEAAFQLGRVPNRRKHIKPLGHRDAVLDLSWNKNFHHIMASASVDKTVLLWDLDKGTPHTKLTVFEDKVQCIKWHPLEAQTLLSGSCDKTAKVFDCRSKESHQSWDLDGETERVVWDPMEPFCFMAATSIGSVHCFDCRKGMIWTVAAHEREVTGLILSNQCKGLMVTTSADGSVSIWDYTYKNIPELVFSKELKLGTIHCLEFCPDSPFIIASGGDHKSHNFTIMDLRSNDPVNHRFGSRPLVQLVESETATVDSNQMEGLTINQT